MEIVIIAEKVIGITLEIKIILHALGQIVEHSALLNDMAGEIFFAIPFALIGITEILNADAAIASDIQKCLIGFALILIEFGKLLDKVKNVLAENVLGIPFFGEILVILAHQLGVSLITMQETAHGAKLIIIGELGNIKPCAENATTGVFVKTSHIYGRIASVVIVLVIIKVIDLNIINLNIIEILCLQPETLIGGCAPPAARLTLRCFS